MEMQTKVNSQKNDRAVCFMRLMQIKNAIFAFDNGMINKDELKGILESISKNREDTQK